jgi:eukaryotic-like serine/threonine-protein kinase
MTEQDDPKRQGLIDWIRRGRDLPSTTVEESPAAKANTSGKTPKTELFQRLVDLGEIGRGGMSSVRRVRDTNLLRDVAMKVLDPELAKSAVRIEGFIEEAQVTGQLDHPNIVPIHELGVDHAGTVYFTMKLVRGQSLFDWLRDPSRPPGSPERLSEGLDVFTKVCDAVSFAHSRGVIHRDLKPSNIMVGEFGEAYLVDWGLARVIGSGVRLARDPLGARAGMREGKVGTVAYMSPEAALERPDCCDERTDVFGLGAVLYEIVTGLPPYCGNDLDAALEAAKRGAITQPEEALRGAGVSRRILRILRKALAPAREDRHQSAAELKADVRRFIGAGLYLPRVGFRPGTRIVSEGEVGDAAYIIVRGHCDVYKTVAGEQRLLRRMGPGEAFGETALLLDSPRTASVEAVDMVTALVVNREALEEGLGLDTWLGTLVKALAQRFRELDEKVHGASPAPAPTPGTTPAEP